MNPIETIKAAGCWLWFGTTRPRAAIGNDLGRRGEAEASRFLSRAGFRVIGRNVRVRAGEADLVCEAPDARTIVIVEVKTRRPAGDGRNLPPPEASITRRKRRKLLAVRRCLVAANRWEDRPVRVDVVAIDWREGEPRVRHYTDIEC